MERAEGCAPRGRPRARPQVSLQGTGACQTGGMANGCAPIPFGAHGNGGTGKVVIIGISSICFGGGDGGGLYGKGTKGTWRQPSTVHGCLVPPSPLMAATLVRGGGDHRLGCAVIVGMRGWRRVLWAAVGSSWAAAATI